MNPLVRPFWRRHQQPQVANGTDQQLMPTPDGSAADAVKAAWLPVRSGQAIPKLGERGRLWRS